MELWHFEFLEGGPKKQKSAKNRQKMDLLILVFIYFRPHALLRYVPELIFSELRNRPHWGKTPVQNGRGQDVENNSPNLVQAISPYKSPFLPFGSGV